MTAMEVVQKLEENLMVLAKPQTEIIRTDCSQDHQILLQLLHHLHRPSLSSSRRQKEAMKAATADEEDKEDHDENHHILGP